MYIFHSLNLFRHDLSQYYLDEIASHIMKNTGGQTLG